jgi:hypothetical protein
MNGAIRVKWCGKPSVSSHPEIRPQETGKISGRLEEKISFPLVEKVKEHENAFSKRKCGKQQIIGDCVWK